MLGGSRTSVDDVEGIGLSVGGIQVLGGLKVFAEADKAQRVQRVPLPDVVHRHGGTLLLLDALHYAHRHSICIVETVPAAFPCSQSPGHDTLQLQVSYVTGVAGLSVTLGNTSCYSLQGERGSEYPGGNTLLLKVARCYRCYRALSTVGITSFTRSWANSCDPVGPPSYPKKAT